MGCGGGGGVEVDAGRCDGPVFVGRDGDGTEGCVGGCGRGAEVVEAGVGEVGGHGAGEVAPGGDGGDAGGFLEGESGCVEGEVGRRFGCRGAGEG